MNKTKNLAPGIAIVMVLMLTTAALLATPVLANPPLPKYVASLEDDNEDRYGQAIFNTNLEEGDCYELEVEVEECMALADSTVNVYLDEEWVCEIEVDGNGNGKVECCVDELMDSFSITVGDEDELTSGEWRLWDQGRGKK